MVNSVMAAGIVPRQPKQPLVETPFTRFLAEALARRGWQAADLAARAGVGRSSISYWLRGTTVPDRVSQERIAEALGVEYTFVRDIVEGVEPSPEQQAAALSQVVVTDPEKVSPLRSLARLSTARLQQVADFFADEIEEDRRRARDIRSRRPADD